MRLLQPCPCKVLQYLRHPCDWGPRIDTSRSYHRYHVFPITFIMPTPCTCRHALPIQTGSYFRAPQATQLVVCSWAVTVARCCSGPALATKTCDTLSLQVKGEWKVKAEHIQPYVDAAQRLTRAFLGPVFGRHLFNLKHVPREQNKVADRLSNVAVDMQL